jgi:hypothetical protein
MEIRSVDPRDEMWESPHPAYRVYFHDSLGASYEYEASGADVVEVLTWAEETRGDRTFVMYACVEQDGLGLVRLYGRDPNSV